MKNFALSAEIILFVFLSYQLGVVCRFYALFKYYDLFVHGLSGFFFTRLGIYLGHKMSESHSKKQNKLVALFGLMFSMTIAVLWEIYEYFGFELFELDSQLLIITGIKDTMEDMIICLIISVLTYLLSLFHYGKRKLIIFKSIDKLIETK